MKIAIAGYGNLAMELERQILKRSNFELVGIFTRRNTAFVKSEYNTPIYSFSCVTEFRDKIDIILCAGGSANDLEVITPYLAKYFCVIDSFEKSDLLFKHKSKTDIYAKKGGKTSLVGCGINSSLLPIIKICLSICFDENLNFSFSKEGKSCGLSNAVKDLEGVLNAAVYEKRENENADYLCFVETEREADNKRIEREIISYPWNFKNGKTNVIFNREFAPEKEFQTTIKLGFSDEKAKTELTLMNISEIKMTAMMMLKFADVVYKMNKSGKTGCFTVFDISASELFEK